MASLQIKEWIKGLWAKDTELDNKISNLSGKVLWKEDNWKTESSPPSEYENFATTIFAGTTNAFNGYNNVNVRTVKRSNNICVQYLEGLFNYDYIYYRRGIDASIWGGLATNRYYR